MRVAVIAPGGDARLAAVAAANRAVLDGCEVLTLLGPPRPGADDRFAAAVALHHGEAPVEDAWSAFRRRWAIDLPDLALRRLRRGPLRRPVRRARRVYRTAVVEPLEQRLLAEAPGRAERAAAAAIGDFGPDLLVLVNNDAIVFAATRLRWTGRRGARVACVYPGPVETAPPSTSDPASPVRQRGVEASRGEQSAAVAPGLVER